MWNLTVGLKDTGQYNTFKEAVLSMKDRVEDMIKKGTSWQIIETAVWIQNDHGDPPIMFYVARDIGAEQAWFAAGESDEIH